MLLVGMPSSFSCSRCDKCPTRVFPTRWHASSSLECDLIWEGNVVSTRARSWMWIIGCFLGAFVVTSLAGGTTSDTEPDETASTTTSMASTSITSTTVTTSTTTSTTTPPTTTTTTLPPTTTTAPPPPPTTVAPTTTTPPTTAPAPQVRYKNCTEARAAGVTPILRGEPGYAKHLDGDGDGIACE